VSALTDRPARLLLRLHLRRTSGLIRLKGPGIDARLWVRNQVLWGAQGVPRLFGPLCDRVPDPRALKGDLLVDIPVLLAMGIGLDDATDAVCKRVGTLLAECTLDQDVQASFENEADPPPGSFGMESPLLLAFVRALPALHPAAQVADELAGWSNTRIRVEDAVGEDLGPLGPIAIRTLALARRNRILGDLVRESGRSQLQRTQQAWLAVDLLRQLGLIRVPGAPANTRPASFNTTSKTSTGSRPVSRTPAAPARRKTSLSPAPTRAPAPPTTAEAPRPRRGSTRRRMPSGLAAFAANAGQVEDHESVEIEAPTSGGWSSNLHDPDHGSPVDSTDRILKGAGEDERTEPFPSMVDDDESAEVEVEFEFNSKEFSASLDQGMTGPMEMGSFEDEEDEEDLEEVFGEPDDDDDSQEVFGEPMDDEDSSEMAFVADEYEDKDYEDYQDDDEEMGTQPLTDLLAPKEEDSSDLGFLIEGIDDEPSTVAPPLILGDPRDQPTVEEGDGFAFQDIPAEDPALPGLRRRLKQLRSDPPLQALGMNHEELLTHTWLPSELAPTWRRARSPWLPENWRNASGNVQSVATEVLELLDETHTALQHAPVYAQALQRSWEAVPKRRSRTADALLLRAQRLCAGAKWDEALKVLDEARKANASSPQALLLQLFARAVTRQIGVSDAVAWVYAISQKTGDSRLQAQGAYTAGRLLERSGNTADALACYRSAKAALPDHKPTQARLNHLAQAAPGAPSALGTLFLEAKD
jgi:tetratricopeptide (TPR) repeat protein